jgi:hypothetical protein
MTYLIEINLYFHRELLELERKCTENNSNTTNMIKMEKDPVAIT